MQRRRATLEAFKALFIRESQRQPLILVIEDLHWLDEQTQAALDFLAGGIGGARVLLVLTYRPEYRHGWIGKSYFSQLRLDPLGPEETAELLGTLLGRQPGLEPIRRTVAERAEGTPLFLEEAVRALVEAGALAGTAGDYAPLRPVDALELPASLHALLAARIDRLPPASKHLLQIASVIGRDVPLALLRRVAGVPDAELDETLGGLQSAELLFETRFDPDREYSFKHALTHEVAYASMLRDRRRALHAEIARAIADSIPRLLPSRSTAWHTMQRRGNFGARRSNICSRRPLARHRARLTAVPPSSYTMASARWGIFPSLLSAGAASSTTRTCLLSP